AGQVPLTHGVDFSARRQPLQRVLADGLQHHHARFAVRTFFQSQQALVNERGDTIHHVQRQRSIRVAHGRCGLQRATTHKHSPPPLPAPSVTPPKTTPTPANTSSSAEETNLTPQPIAPQPV